MPGKDPVSVGQRLLAAFDSAPEHHAKEMNDMTIPGFTADAALYKTSGHYSSGRHHATGENSFSTAGVMPALPSRENCEYAFDSCAECRGRKGPRGNCPTCHLAFNWCGGSGNDGGGGRGNEGDWIDFANCSALCNGNAHCIDTFC